MFKDEVFEYFTKTIPELHKRFDDSHKNEIKELNEYVSKIFATLTRIFSYPDQNKINEIQFASAMLLWRGVNTIIASFELIRSGYGIEPLVVARNALETCTSAIDFYKNPNKYEDFKKLKYKSSESIGEGKKVIPIIGVFYGLLTKFFSHVSLVSSFPLHYKDDTGRVILTTGGIYGKNNEYYLNMNLALISLLLSIYLASAEFIFLKFCEKSEFWRRIDIDKPIFVFTNEETERHKIRVEKLKKMLRDLPPLKKEFLKKKKD